MSPEAMAGGNREDHLEMGIVTHSSIVGWRTPWTEGPGGLQSKDSGTAERLTLGGEGTGPQSHPCCAFRRLLLW